MMYDALHLQSKSVKLNRWKSNALKKWLLFTKSVYFSVWLPRQQIEMQKILKIKLESIVLRRLTMWIKLKKLEKNPYYYADKIENLFLW